MEQKYDFMLAKDYEKGMKAPRSDPKCLPPLNWVMSEKFDGYRARWIHELCIFLSRNQKEFQGTPEWFSDLIPEEDLDGELWCGRDNFQSMGVVRRHDPDPEEWLPIKYIVYDLPEHPGTFHERLIELRKIITKGAKKWLKDRKALPEPYCDLEYPVVMADQIKIESYEQMDQYYKSILQKDGEGIMIKDPNSRYEDGRSNYMLKVKPSFDEEAVIVDYTKGKGKYNKCLGGFVCKPLENHDTYHVIVKNPKREFTLSGMDDETRNNYKITHPIGTVISYEHSGKTATGKPRFGRYLRIRDDIVIKDDVEKTGTEKVKLLMKVLSEISDFEKMKGETFKASSYRKVVNELKKISDDSELTKDNIMNIKGVGTSIFTKIEQILKTGTCPLYDKIKKDDSVDSKMILMGIHGVGPKKATDLINSGYDTIQKLRDCENIESILTAKQIIGLKHYEHLNERIPRDEIVKHEELLQTTLKKIDPDAEMTIAGSYRRGCDTSGDIDVLIKTKKKNVFKRFIKVLTNINYLIDHLANGTKKYNGVSKCGKNGKSRRIDIMNTTPQEYPFAVLYFTGSKDHNTKLRGIANEKGMTMNEYCLSHIDTEEKVEGEFSVEEDIFSFLGVKYVLPKDR